MSEQSAMMSLDEILTSLASFINRYMVLPGKHDAETVALWAAHTWVINAFYTTPRLVFSSATKGSGKTRGIEILALICHEPELTISSTPAAMFRTVGYAHREGLTPPTILFDEIDSVYGAKSPSESTEQLRGLMNAGYKRGATVARCEGSAESMQVIKYQVFSSLALAGIAGKLPDTIESRSIVIHMKKRLPSENVTSYKERKAVKEIAPTVEALQTWAKTAVDHLSEAEPTMPKGVEDRPAEVWEPLLAIADMAGEQWGKLAREACKDHVFTTKGNSPTLELELLSDIREVMGYGTTEGHEETAEIATTELIHRLQSMEDSQWRSLPERGGNPIDSRFVSRQLKRFGVQPVVFKKDGATKKGYVVDNRQKQDGLADAWLRYLPAPSKKSVTSVTKVTEQVEADLFVTERETVTGNQGNQLPEKSVTETGKVTAKNAVTSKVTEVTEVTDFLRGIGKSASVNHLTDVQKAIIGTLSRSRGQSLSSIASATPGVDKSTVETELGKLVESGAVTINHRSKYLLAS